MTDKKNHPPSGPPMSKICAICHAVVERKDCHRNRYRQYICHTCQAAGLKTTWQRRFRKWTKLEMRKAAQFLAVAGVVVVFVWLFFNFLARIDG
jgi:hypothetical protein